ncbi:MAG: hypothetical protein HQK66_04730 [Desulfamplus sp.]|nr:hypothetical protein [Desulfamplus sp.]
MLEKKRDDDQSLDNLVSFLEIVNGASSLFEFYREAGMKQIELSGQALGAIAAWDKGTPQALSEPVHGTRDTLSGNTHGTRNTLSGNTHGTRNMHSADPPIHLPGKGYKITG